MLTEGGAGSQGGKQSQREHNDNVNYKQRRLIKKAGAFPPTEQQSSFKYVETTTHFVMIKTG